MCSIDFPNGRDVSDPVPGFSSGVVTSLRACNSSQRPHAYSHRPLQSVHGFKLDGFIGRQRFETSVSQDCGEVHKHVGLAVTAFNKPVGIVEKLAHASFALSLYSYFCCQLPCFLAEFHFLLLKMKSADDVGRLPTFYWLWFRPLFSR